MNKGLILVSSKRLLYLCQDVQGKVDMVSLERCIDDVYTQGRSSQSTAAHGSPSAVPSLSVRSLFQHQNNWKQGHQEMDDGHKTIENKATKIQFFWIFLRKFLIGIFMAGCQIHCSGTRSNLISWNQNYKLVDVNFRWLFIIVLPPYDLDETTPNIMYVDICFDSCSQNILVTVNSSTLESEKWSESLCICELHLHINSSAKVLHWRGFSVT